MKQSEINKLIENWDQSMGTKPLSIAPAYGETFVLLNTGAYQDVILRSYKADGEFQDYMLSHSDLLIKVIDSEAHLYAYPSGEITIDHSPQALGLKGHSNE